jgi:hypothetical protein
MSSLIYIITGHDAILLAERESLQIRCCDAAVVAQKKCRATGLIIGVSTPSP